MFLALGVLVDSNFLLPVGVASQKDPVVRTLAPLVQAGCIAATLQGATVLAGFG